MIVHNFQVIDGQTTWNSLHKNGISNPYILQLPD